MSMSTSRSITPELKIVIVSASQAATSRSRLAARYAQEWLAGQKVEVDFIDLQDYRILSYPHSEADPEVSTLIERFKAADGWVLAGPVYNWGASGVLVNFLHYALDDLPQDRYRPFILIGGAGGVKSHLALDSLGRMMIYEISAVQVGPPVLAAGPLVDRPSETVAPELKERLQHAMEVLVHFVQASAIWRAGKRSAVG